MPRAFKRIYGKITIVVFEFGKTGIRFYGSSTKD